MKKFVKTGRIRNLKDLANADLDELGKFGGIKGLGI